MRQYHIINSLLGIIAAISITGVGLAYTTEPIELSEAVVEQELVPELVPDSENTESVAPEPPREFASPISRPHERANKKPFGLFITPETSPIENDRFHGFHVGVDFETTPEEGDVDITISTMCKGPLLFKKYATGYGGMVAQGCVIDGKEVTVIYGHLNIASVTLEPGTILEPGVAIGVLGRGNSEETNGVRKHLHLGIREGRTTDIRGYVKEDTELINWLNPLQYIPE